MSLAETRGNCRSVRPSDAGALTELFALMDAGRFHPHPFTPQEADRIATRVGKDVYAVMEMDGLLVAYGILRGWDEDFAIPSLGIGVRPDCQRRGYGRRLMVWLAHEAEIRGADRVRLRVHPNNLGARRLYESLGYRVTGEERGELVMVLLLRPSG